MIKNNLRLLSIALVLGVFGAHAQTWTGTKIEEYYSNTPLNKVLEDFKTKYHIPITYDTIGTRFEKITYWFSGTRARAALPIVFHQVKSFDFKYAADSSVTVVAKVVAPEPVDDEVDDVVDNSEYNPTPQKSVATETSKFNGAPQRTNLTVTGILRDGMSNEVLPFATIGVRGTTLGASTNVDGYFTLFRVPSDTAALIIRFVGYDPLIYYLNPNTKTDYVQIALQPSSTQISEVKVVGNKGGDLLKVSGDVGAVSMSPMKIAELPSLGEHDIFRAFQLLPGVGGSNEGSSGLNVRGGSADQNLILFDGFTVYHQDHLFGVFSAFNYNAIKDVKLYKGGFEAKYGGRLSSVMDIVGKNGNERKVNWGGDASLLGIGGFLEIPLWSKGSILVAGRRSYQGLLYDKFFDAYNSSSNNQQVAARAMPPGMKRNEETVSPTSYFYDVNVKASYRITEKDYLSWSLFRGEDNLDNSRTFARVRGAVSLNGGITDKSNWGNTGSSLKWSRKWNSKLYTNNLISFSRYFNNRTRINSRMVVRNDSIYTPSDGSVEENYLYDYSFKQDNELKLSDKQSLEFGLQATLYQVKYQYILNDTSNVVSRNDKSFLGSLYVQDRITLGRGVTLLPGIRASYFSLAKVAHVEPRLQTSYQLTDKLKLKASWGLYHQYINRVLREDVSAGSRDVWILADGSKVPISKAMHYIAGFSYETQQWLFDVEAYYKKLDGLSEYTLRFSPSFGGKVDYSSLFYTGQGFSRGIDFLVQRKIGNFGGWVGYTLGQSRNSFAVYGNGYFPSLQDITHEFKVVTTYHIGRWDFSASWIYATGKPYTAPAGSYTITQPDGSTSSYLVVGSKNATRYPNYHRLDVSAKYNFLIFGAIKSSIALSVFNLYNHQNIWYKEFSSDETGLTETNAYLLGFTPNLTFTFKRR